jgi:hypothetical protein
LVDALAKLQGEVDGMTASWEKANNYFSSNPILAALVQTFQEASNPIQAFNRHVSDFNSMLGLAGDTGKKTAPKIAASTQSIGDLTKATATAQTALGKFNQALLGLGQTNLSASQANIAYQQSLADTTAAIQKNGKSLDVTTQAGRDNMTALDGIASSAITLIAAQQKAGASADSLSGQMASARQQFINAAVAAGDTTAQANKLADQYGLIPKDVSTAFITSGAQAAIAAADAVKNAYDRINKQITIRVDSIISNSYTNPNGMGLGTGGLPQAKGKADGGSIGMSSGGSVFGPGNAASDSAGLYRLANGEFVVSNKQGQADRFRPLLKMINAGQNPMVASAPSVTHVTHQHSWNLYGIQDPGQLSQQMAARMNARAV